VVAHATSLNLYDCDFVVNPSGKRRALRTKERNVHAFIRGFIGEKINGKYTVIGYDVFSEKDFFVLENTVTKTNLKKAKACMIDGDGVFALDPM
jgi:hypothetical protein